MRVFCTPAAGADGRVRFYNNVKRHYILFVLQEEIKMLTQLCARRETQYAQQENDLKRERDELIKRGFVAQNQLTARQSEYKIKLEAMTKIYKNVMDVRHIENYYLKIDIVIYCQCIVGI